MNKSTEIRLNKIRMKKHSNDYGLIISNEIDVTDTNHNEIDDCSDQATIDEDDSETMQMEYAHCAEYYHHYEFMTLMDRLKERLLDDELRKRKIDAVIHNIGTAVDFLPNKISIHNLPQQNDKAIMSMLLDHLKMAIGLSYLDVNPNYFRFIHRPKNDSLQEMFKDFELNPSLLESFKKIGPQILETTYGTTCDNVGQLIHLYQTSMLKLQSQSNNWTMQDLNDTEKSYALEQDFDKLIKISLSVKNNDQQTDVRSLDPLLRTAMSLEDFQHNVLGKSETISVKRLFIFKCWTCKYYYRLGQTQLEFYQFQFKDFCSFQCLSLNVRNNGRCSFCYRKSDPTVNAVSDSDLDWSNCSHTFTFYHPEDLGKDYLEIFHDHDHYQRYLQTTRRCHICQIELRDDLGDSIKSLRIKCPNNEFISLDFCHQHRNDYRIRTWSTKSNERPPKCNICTRELCSGIPYADDQFCDEQKLSFCSKHCKLLHFKRKRIARQNHFDCCVCYARVSIDHSNYDDQFRYYLIRSLWTWYTVCSSNCYRKFRRDYQFSIECATEECHTNKSHSDMIAVMRFNTESKSLQMTHFCSPKCLQKSGPQWKAIMAFHPLPIHHVKYTSDTRFERDIVQDKCLKCRAKFTRMRGSLWQFCSIQCFTQRLRICSFMKNIHSNNQTYQANINEQLIDTIYYSQIAKKLSEPASGNHGQHSSSEISATKQQIYARKTLDLERIKQSRLNAIRKKISQQKQNKILNKQIDTNKTII